MQIKIFNIPIPFGEAFNEDLNVFLRSQKIISVEEHLVQEGPGAYWSFVVKYMDGAATYDRGKPKVDYKKILDESTFTRFAVLRDIRKRVAKDDAVPAYVVFSDEELIRSGRYALRPSASRCCTMR